jgi:demethylmenaquinone methyltransferase/2-methoxy-6-polyprenyl-1,4-benzoquinol methylase
MQDDDLLAEQRASYRARAPEYDDWWLRRGRYDRGEADAREWGKQVATVAAALDGFGPKGDVLELAGGTSWWTERLARTATRLTVVDSSPEMLERNRARVGRADVEYVNADLFEWRPPRTYDLVFFSFWISHVPRARLASFWALVRACPCPAAASSWSTTATTRHRRPTPCPIRSSCATSPTSTVDGSATGPSTAWCR